jgi:hypothetical protein
MFRYSEIAADLRLGREGIMNQIQESLIHITRTLALEFLEGIHGRHN